MDSDFSLPEDCGYNKIFKHQWKTSQHGLPLNCTHIIDSYAEGKWGWHFIPHKSMKWEKEDWYKDQTLVITFEKQMDLILCKLVVDIT